MKIAIATVQAPFIRGGAEAMTSGLSAHLKSKGHEVDVVSMPFRFSPPKEVMRSMLEWKQQDFEAFDCGSIDLVIALKFPSYYLNHSRKIVWLMHQHRSVYELFGTEYGELVTSEDAKALRKNIIEMDTQELSRAISVFTISKTVSDRLMLYNGVKSTPIYQPPPNADQFHPGPFYPYIYAPSRLESLKRQDLLIKAIKKIKAPIYVVIAGVGGQLSNLKKLVEDASLQNKVIFAGRVSTDQHIRYFTNAFMIYFAPYCEDYGYVTLEAMLSAKPILTCTDSGGPTEFVTDGETGFIVAPNPDELAFAIDLLWSNRSKGIEMGYNALRRYKELNISWDNVIKTLIGEHA